MTKLSIKTLLLASSALALTSPALAGDTDQIEEVVVTATRIPTKISAVGGSVTVITADEIKAQQKLSVADILRYTPGMSIGRNGGLGAASFARIRGAESGQTLVLINGVKVNDLSGPGGEFNFANLMTDDVTRIEVLRGQQSSLYGTNAAEGVVSIKMGGGDDDGLSARAQLETGAFSTFRAGGGVSFGGETLNGTISVNRVKSDGISAAAAEDGNSEQDGYETTAVLATATAKLSEQLSLTGFFRYADNELELDSFDWVLGFVDGDEFEASTDQQIGFGATYAMLDGRLTHSLNYALSDIDRDNFVVGEKSFAAKSERRNLDYSALFEATDALTVLAGAEVENNKIETESFGFWPSSLEGSADISSLFATVQWHGVEGLTITGGVRHDDHESFGGQTTMRISGAYDVAANTTLRANWGEGFKAPTLFQLFSSFGDPTLLAEESTGWEIGVDQKLGKGTFGATYFERNSTNMVDFSMATFTYANLGRTRAKGVELTAFYPVSDAVSVNANFTHLTSKDRDTGAALLRRPENTANMSVNWAPTSKLSGSFGINHVGKRQDISGPLDAYTVVDTRVNYALQDEIEFFARIENLLNKSYQEVEGYGTAGRSLYGGIRLKF